MLLAILLFGMSLAGCVGQTDGVTEISPSDRPSAVSEIESIETWWMSSTNETATTNWVHGFNLTIFYAVHDWYSGIDTAGFDIDLDGINDQNVSDSSGFEVIFIPFNETDESETGSRVISFRFGAMSSENIWSDNPIQYHIVTGNFDAWGHLTSSSQNTFDASDASAAVSSATDDTLLRLSWTYADEDLNWAFVSFKLEIGDNVYDCEVAANAADGDECMIVQNGGDSDTQWESDEIVFVQEHNTDICNAQCTVEITVQYNGQVLSGTPSVPVA